MPFLPSRESKGVPSGERKHLAFRTAFTYKGRPYHGEWDMGRAVVGGMQGTTWVFRAVDHIAKNQAGLPFIMRQDHPVTGEPVKDHFLLPLMNQFPNDFENAWAFRYRLSSQILLSRRGAFIELIRNRRGNVMAMVLHDPGTVAPIPDPVTFVSGYEVTVGYEKEIVPADRMVWLRLPHPTNPYASITPLEAAGLAVETDILTKQFNRNFLMNDGRPGGILAIKGGMEEEDAEALRQKFLGSGSGMAVHGAGRLTVIDTGDGGVDFVDTAITPRDAQYSELRKANKEEILLAFGVSEAVIGNSSGRTYDNASVEAEQFWRATMLPHLMLISRALDRVDGSEKLYPAFDVSSIYVLNRDEREQFKYYLEEYKAGTISADEYRLKTGQEPIGDDHRYIDKNKVQYELDGSIPLRQEVVTIKPAEQSTLPEAPEPAEPDFVDGEPLPELPAAGESSAKEAVIDIKETPYRDQTLAKRVNIWEKHLANQLEGYFRRQEKVVTEKLLSKKMRDKWAAGEAIDIDDIFSKSRYDEQLADDASLWLNLVYADLSNDEKSPDLQILNNLISENAKTYGLLVPTLASARAENATLDSLAGEVKAVFTGAIHGRARQTARRVIAEILG